MTSHASQLFAVALLSLLSGPALAQGVPEPSPGSAPAGAVPATPAPADVAPPEGGAGHDGSTMRFEADVSTQLREVTGSATKLDEYGTVNEGLLLDTLSARYHRPGSGHFLEIGVRNAAQDDEAFSLSLGRRGAYRFDVAYQALPHYFTGGTFLFGGFGTGRLLVPDVVQAQLQANEATAADRGGPPPAGDPTLPVPLDLAQQSIVGGLYSAADSVTFGIDRRRIGGAFEFPLFGDLRGFVRVQNENRTGARVIGTGSYERWQNGAGAAHTIDRFVTLGAELAEPIDYRTFGASAGVAYERETWSADVEYGFTLFRNFEGVLRWDNPFRITDAAQVGSVERSRFAVGQLVLPPDSAAHDVTASGAIALPMHGRLAASLSWGMITQDDAFYPYTQNGAIAAVDRADTALGAANTLALPAPDLGGDVRTIAATLSAAVRPLDPLTVTAKYRAYRYDGRSDEITFPGYAAFGESAWRRERNDVTAGFDAPVANEVFDYWRHEADLGADYRLSRLLSLSLEGGWEGWRYDHMRVDATDEWSIGAGATLKPMRATSLRARYRYSDRTASGYLRGNTAENPEARGLMNYNWSDRRRHLADARAQWAPTRALSVGVTGRIVDEAYGGETEGGTMVDQFRFGRTDVTAYGAALDVTVTPLERLSLQASYARDHRKETMASVAKDDGPKSAGFFVNPDGTPLVDNYSPVNYWESDITDVADTFGVGATFDVLPQRVVIDARYDLSFSDVDVDTRNPNPVDTGAATPTLANAVANDWPAVKTRLHEASVDLGYRFSASVRAGIRYLYANFDVDDWAWDIMAPYMAGRSAENSTRYVFAQATYNAYEAHVGTVYVTGSF
jgi:MtrB/PioB family decaheme-associated outer membrane protein